MTKKARRSRWVRVACWFLAFCATVAIVALVFFLVLFPGAQRSIAFALATGIGTPGLQTRVDAIEEKAVEVVALADDDKAFLNDLYVCFAKGGKYSSMAPESSRMMFRYLSGTGEDLRTRPELFLRSGPVQRAMGALRNEMEADIRNGKPENKTYRSAEFYMGDPANFDTFVALYFGHVAARIEAIDEKTIIIIWRAECPWTWPSYEELHETHGQHGAQRFAIPNARSFVTGRREDRLLIGDGLGGHLAEIGLAKPFLVYAEWQEETHLDAGK